MLKKIISVLRKIFQLNYKTIYFNFHYLDFKDAIRFPFFIGNNVVFNKLKGEIKINDIVKMGMIRIGKDGISIFDNQFSRTILDIDGVIIFGGEASIGQGSKISVGAMGNLELGKNFRITAQSTLISYQNVKFGDDCLISWNVQLMDTDFHGIYDETALRLNPNKPITIGSNVWIGYGASILKGAIIPNGCVIASSTTVAGVLEKPNAVYVSKSDIKKVRDNISWRN
jgi:acetyltransferase-like isoleucine patch superfamily enzyme